MNIGLAFGRPPQITLPFVDCEVDPDTEQAITADGKIVHGCTSFTNDLDIVCSADIHGLKIYLFDRQISPPHDNFHHPR
jgi:hypothetical protein